MNDITFKYPEVLFLLVLIVPFAGWYYLVEDKLLTKISLPIQSNYSMPAKSWRHYLFHLPFICRLSAITLLIVALSRPQVPKNWKDVTSTGIDIVIAIDISSSMLAKDFGQSRLDASKDVARDFIKGRKSDRIGVVAFSGESYTLFPLTTDYDALTSLFYKLQPGMITDGTAIGMGLATSAKNLKDSKSRGKVIILLTDGVNNAGTIDPMEAAEFAHNLNISVYTISIGGRATGAAVEEGGTSVISSSPDVLQDIANITGGKYFTSSNKDNLVKVYEEIDMLEKSKVSTREFGKKEAYLPFAIAAFCFLLFEMFVKFVLIRKFP